MKKEIELWNEIGQRVFARHVQEDGSRFPEHEKMITVNEVSQTNEVQSLFSSIINHSMADATAVSMSMGYY